MKTYSNYDEIFEAFNKTTDIQEILHLYKEASRIYKETGKMGKAWIMFESMHMILSPLDKDI